MIIISLGGSVIVPDAIDINFLKKFKRLILKQKGKKFIIICGGGKTCRNYQNAAKKLCKPNGEELDWIGISSTKLNAELVKTIFGNKAYGEIVLDSTKKYRTNKPIIIGAGWKPGCSTDYDAVLFAKSYKAKKIINISNIDYVYDKDPRKHRNAKRIEKMTWKELKKLIGGKWSPGLNAPFDPIAAKLAEKLKLKVAITSKNINNLNNIINDKEFKGTFIA